MTKAIDLQEPYRTAWNKHCAEDRQRVPDLNLDLKGFLDAQAAAFAGFPRIVYMGNMKPQRRGIHRGETGQAEEKEAQKG